MTSDDFEWTTAQASSNALHATHLSAWTTMTLLSVTSGLLLLCRGGGDGLGLGLHGCRAVGAGAGSHEDRGEQGRSDK